MESEPFWRDRGRRIRLIRWLALGLGGLFLAGMIVAGGVVAALLNLRRAALIRQKFAAIPARPPACAGLAVSEGHWQGWEFQYPSDWTIEAGKAQSADLRLSPKQQSYATARWTIRLSQQAGDPPAADAGSAPWTIKGRQLKPGRSELVHDAASHDFFTYARQDVAGREAVLELARRYSFWRNSAYDQWTLWIRDEASYRSLTGPTVERADDALNSHVREEHCPFWIVANSLRPKN